MGLHLEQLDLQPPLGAFVLAPTHARRVGVSLAPGREAARAGHVLQLASLGAQSIAQVGDLIELLGVTWLLRGCWLR